jgi:DNA-binding response OmpR family regulator
MSSLSALIIEDDLVIANVFAKALKSIGMETVTNTDGGQALDRLRVYTPDLVLLDLHLPTVHGSDILSYIRGEARLSQTRIIIVSADEIQTNYMGSQADLALVKPVGFYQLRDIVISLFPELE